MVLRPVETAVFIIVVNYHSPSMEMQLVVILE